jgi:hypothetical protein
VTVIAKPHENSNILDLTDSSSLNFDGGSRSMWGGFVMKILIPIYYVLHS